jgi:hypothetical protein
MAPLIGDHDLGNVRELRKEVAELAAIQAGTTV